MEEDEFKEEEVQQSLKEQLTPKSDAELPINPGLRVCTKALFYEWRHHTTCSIRAPYTLKDFDYTYRGKTYTSMYMVYMKCDSEYEAAIKILGSYKHWCKLKECSWFIPYIERWESERNIRDEAVARSMLLLLAEAGNVTAARSVFTNTNNSKAEKVGRPSRKGKRSPTPQSDILSDMLDSSKDADE